MKRFTSLPIASISPARSNEEWNYVGVEEWPSLEALESRAKFEYEGLEKFNIIESKTYLGTCESFAEYGKE